MALRLQALQFRLELRELPVAQLRHLVQIIGALRFLHLEPRRLDLLAQLARPADRGLLLFPREPDALRLLPGFGELLAQHVEPARARVGLLLGGRRLLDLEPQLHALARHELHSAQVDVGAHRVGLALVERAVLGAVGRRGLRVVERRRGAGHRIGHGAPPSVGSSR